ncbi:hypothetical protein BST91_11665 [Nonlabens tegetincola]|uniref:hypothetical protein n=1 Tax=Nonlabens tegetincola TaxID=323273 RepID=UPI000A2022C8|nr:hypothetical protein [Nonlabens tegetincola]ARN72270.1 hypothetical protein BST91_11665 [Nonlabens tegetincola]
MSKFKTVAIFSYPADAAVIKSKLESEGVTVILRDEFTIATDPFATNAIGGIKMDVYREEYLKAINIIETVNPEILSTVTQLIKCPNCKKRQVREQHDVHTATNFKETITAIYLSIFPFTGSEHYVCKNCNHKFDING